MTQLNIENQRGYTILSAILSTDRTGQSVDIAPSILDFDIYEHLDKPYLTADFVFNDNYGLVNLFDVQGVESLALTLESLTKDIISKNFRIVNISKSTKGNDRSELVFVETVEEHAFISNSLNVCKAYTGTPGDIIAKISKEFLNKETTVIDQSYQGNMKVIVPNKNPIESMKWMQQRSTNQDGMPYYVYSTLLDDTLIFDHLGNILSANPINVDKPYVYSQAPTADNGYFTIESYKYENAQNTFTMIKKGYVGAEYRFLNLSNAFEQKTQLNAETDIFNMIKDNNYLPLNQNNPNYPYDSKVKQKPLGQQQSKVITSINAANTFAGYGDFKTYAEEADETGYKKNIIGKALKYHLAKSPLSINIAGAPFLMGGKNLTIGNIIRIKFFDSKIAVEKNGNEIGIDTQKSGDYIIYAAKHTFKVEKYDLSLLCLKISNLTGETL